MMTSWHLWADRLANCPAGDEPDQSRQAMTASDGTMFANAGRAAFAVVTTPRAKLIAPATVVLPDGASPPALCRL